MTRQELTAEEYEKNLSEGIVPAENFRPAAFYNHDGDCIEFFFSNEPFTAERLDSLLTVYRGRESNEVVGSLIKGVSKIFRGILKRAPGFKIPEIRDGRVKLEYLITACLWSSERDPEGTEVAVYNTLRDAAELGEVEADTRELCLA